MTGPTLLHVTQKSYSQTSDQQLSQIFGGASLSRML